TCAPSSPPSSQPSFFPNPLSQTFFPPPPPLECSVPCFLPPASLPDPNSNLAAVPPLRSPPLRCVRFWEQVGKKGPRPPGRFGQGACGVGPLMVVFGGATLHPRRGSLCQVGRRAVSLGPLETPRALLRGRSEALEVPQRRCSSGCFSRLAESRTEERQGWWLQQKEQQVEQQWAERAELLRGLVQARAAMDGSVSEIWRMTQQLSKRHAQQQEESLRQHCRRSVYELEPYVLSDLWAYATEEDAWILLSSGSARRARGGPLAQNAETAATAPETAAPSKGANAEGNTEHHPCPRTAMSLTLFRPSKEALILVLYGGLDAEGCV
ncbi:uncharacterized protein LOC34620993, partial [Cyclospora cayetanensis]|uniref:Uncharacterized protein LOC34620993 n=1 Tax=Cyclospora cayetanensis TaxID=88456 RepID=A0A6P6RZZ9_9EIME